MEGLQRYTFGRTDFDQDSEYGVKIQLVHEVCVDAQNHTLRFPGNAKPGGFVVGLIVEHSLEPRVPACIHISRDLVLGQTTAEIEVTGKGVVVSSGCAPDDV